MSRALRGESQPSACAWVALPASRATPWAKWPPTLLRAQAFMHAPGTHRARPPRGRGCGAGSSCESSACADLEDEELQLALMLSASESAVPAEWAPVQSAAGRCAAPAHAASWQGEGWQSALEQRLAEQQQQWQAGLWQPGQLASGTRGAEGGGGRAGLPAPARRRGGAGFGYSAERGGDAAWGKERSRARACRVREWRGGGLALGRVATRPEANMGRGGAGARAPPQPERTTPRH